MITKPYIARNYNKKMSKENLQKKHASLKFFFSIEKTGGLCAQPGQK